MDDYNLSQIVRRFLTTEAAIGAPVIELAASITPAEASVSTQSQYHHGIDFKNPFTMSKKVVDDPYHRAKRRTFVFIIWKNAWMVEPIGIEPMT